MTAGFFITFRETLEAALVIGIVLAYLYRTKNTKYLSAVWIGAAIGIILSIIFAAAFITLVGEFEGKYEQIFEGTILAIAAVLITTLVLWLLGHTTAKKIIEKQVSTQVNKKQKTGITLLIAACVLREGVETVIFLGAATLAIKTSTDLIFGVLGIIAALVTAYLFFTGTKKVPLKIFFNITTVVLVLFGAGIAALSVHEFQEAGIIPIGKAAFNINPAQNPNGTYLLMHDKGAIGIALHQIFGYKGNPTWPELIVYFSYLGIVCASAIIMQKNAKNSV